VLNGTGTNYKIFEFLEFFTLLSLRAPQGGRSSRRAMIAVLPVARMRIWWGGLPYSYYGDAYFAWIPG